MKSQLSIASTQIKNFKAIQDSKSIRLGPLTVFIGNNGSGKSSMVEALETLQFLALQGIDEAMQAWYGFEHIWNKASSHKKIRGKVTHPMTFIVRGTGSEGKYKCSIEVAADANYDRVFIQNYKASYRTGEFMERPNFIVNGEIEDPQLKAFVRGWQFLKLDPYDMSDPIPMKRTFGFAVMSKNGTNIAEYLQSIRDKDLNAFNGIIDTLRVVLPYVEDLQPTVASELDRKIYLMMSEAKLDAKLPGWLLSTGTMRVLALLAILRHPEPPPLVVIEEIENGLDPRTIHLLVDEIRYFVESGLGQVIATTHSPYLLDLLKLDHLIVVDRDASGTPVFTRPGSQKALDKWAQNFSPGKLYTMGKLARVNS